MQVAVLMVFLAGVYPFFRAWRASRPTPLLSAVAWASVTWGGWAVVALVSAEMPAAGTISLRYLALCLTCCAGVSVLGARRPGAGPWNAVVAGLLGILLLPLAEQMLVGANTLGWLRLVFLGATLAFIFLNYLPTCFAPIAFLFAMAMGIELKLVQEPTAILIPETANLLGLALMPWLALLIWHTRPRPPSEFDRLWRDFRNRWGFVWAARVREQFNRAADNAGWPVHLYWQGLHVRRGEMLPDSDMQDDILRTLQALLKRFG